MYGALKYYQHFNLILNTGGGDHHEKQYVALFAPRSGAFIQPSVKKWFRAFLTFYNVILAFLAVVWFAKIFPKYLSGLPFLRATLWRRPTDLSYYEKKWSIWRVFLVAKNGRKNSVFYSRNAENISSCVSGCFATVHQTQKRAMPMEDREKKILRVGNCAT